MMMRASGLLSLAFLAIACFSFSPGPNQIDGCFINFNKASRLSDKSPERLPETAEKVRQLQTGTGNIEVSRIDGYRILYINKKKAPFVNVKVELSDPKQYSSDTTNILENLKFLNAQGTNMEKDLVQLNYNGYHIYGISRSTIETGSIRGSFVMFPGNGVTVYFDFNNARPEFRTFENIEDYKSQRNVFLAEYTNHLNKCSGK